MLSTSVLCADVDRKGGETEVMERAGPSVVMAEPDEMQDEETAAAVVRGGMLKVISGVLPKAAEKLSTTKWSSSPSTAAVGNRFEKVLLLLHIRGYSQWSKDEDGEGKKR